MFLRLLNWFRNSVSSRNDFSAFFREKSLDEQKKILEKVVRKANRDQKEIVKQYRKIHPETT